MYVTTVKLATAALGAHHDVHLAMVVPTSARWDAAPAQLQSRRLEMGCRRTRDVAVSHDGQAFRSQRGSPERVRAHFCRTLIKTTPSYLQC